MSCLRKLPIRELKQRRQERHLKISLRVSAIISQLFKVITRGKCVLTILELNCNQRFRDKKTNLNICHHMLTSSTQLSHRGKNENVCQMFKNEKCTCKACKTIVFHCQICKFVRFLLPSSSWLLKLPIHFGEQIGMRGFSFWVVSLK